MNNPFFYGNLVEPAQFFNRRRPLRQVVSRILYQGQSAALIGEPRSGKTSLLRYIQAPENREALYGEQGERFVFSFINAQILGGQFTQAQFWETALSPLVEHVIGSQPDTPLAAQYRLCRENNFGTFNLIRLFDALHQEDRRLVLLVDEFDALLYHPVLNSAEFYGSLRHLASNSRGALALVLSSRQSLSQLNAETQQFNPAGSPYFNIFKEIKLSNFPGKDIAALLRLAGDTFSSADRRFINTVAGGNPYLLQLTAATMWDAITTGEDDVFRRYMSVGQEVYQQTKSHYAETWRVWMPATRKAVATLALSQMPFLLDKHTFLNQKFLKDLPDFMPEINDLTYIGIIEKADDIPGGYRLTQGAMLWWLADELLRLVRQDTPFDVWLRGQHLRGPVTERELQYLRKAGAFALDLLTQGAATLVEAYAKGLAGGS